MEILTIISHHRSYDNGGRTQIADAYRSSPSRGLRGINCRTYESKMGILPAPSYEIIPSGSPQVTSQRSVPFYSEPAKQPRRSNPITIGPRLAKKVLSFDDELCDSERWAGPTYSNSPPPSSLPMPNFSLCQRTVSFEISRPIFGNEDRPHAKSAPSSPDKKSYFSSSDFFIRTDTATQGLRRILHLDT
ncbi:unnamed protein product [Spirodela intermedia]|uniref:Uncharacterized protein n=1 Tax=Spirodela intermedia TaxID=51605 RepID=A0A7I8JWW2_SPIIN|nr:unnamed protein product [Spirodela intermedia]